MNESESSAPKKADHPPNLPRPHVYPAPGSGHQSSVLTQINLLLDPLQFPFNLARLSRLINTARRRAAAKQQQQHLCDHKWTEKR